MILRKLHTIGGLMQSADGVQFFYITVVRDNGEQDCRSSACQQEQVEAKARAQEAKKAMSEKADDLERYRLANGILPEGGATGGCIIL